MVLGQALHLVLTGIATGLLASAALTSSLSGLLRRRTARPDDLCRDLAHAADIATLAAYVPARRSMRMAPVEALRTEC
jgi:hypothetical protein